MTKHPITYEFNLTTKIANYVTERNSSSTTTSVVIVYEVLMHVCVDFFYVVPVQGCKVLQRACLYVCLTERLSSRIYLRNFTKFSVHVTHGRGRSSSDRQCNT